MLPRFAKLYSEVGRPSIAPERLLRALLLQIFNLQRRIEDSIRDRAVHPEVEEVLMTKTIEDISDAAFQS